MEDNEDKLLNDPDYQDDWVRDQIKNSTQWFLDEIFREEDKDDEQRTEHY